MTITMPDARRALVDLLPRFLMAATRGWDGLIPLLDASGLDRPAFFLLRALMQERDVGIGMTHAEMHADLFNPYSTIRPILDALPLLIETRHVQQQGDHCVVTGEGREVVARIDDARDAYLASLAPIPAADLARLVAMLAEVAARLRDAPEPTRKAHQARAWRVMPAVDAAPMVRLYGIVYALWMARDDAHIAAWRAPGFDGPTFDLLSRVWSGETATVTALTGAVQQFQRPEDVARGIVSLIAAGYLTRDGEMLRDTPHGKETRDRIERETDRIAFTPWPFLSHADIAWLSTTLAAVIAGIPSSS